MFIKEMSALPAYTSLKTSWLAIDKSSPILPISRIVWFQIFRSLKLKLLVA